MESIGPDETLSMRRMIINAHLHMLRDTISLGVVICISTPFGFKSKECPSQSISFSHLMKKEIECLKNCGPFENTCSECHRYIPYATCFALHFWGKWLCLSTSDLTQCVFLRKYLLFFVIIDVLFESYHKNVITE